MSLIMPNGKPSVEQFQDWNRQTFGREANPMELQQIGERIGPAGEGGYTQEQYQRAQQEATNMARAQGWNGPNPQTQDKPQQQQQPPQHQQINGVPLTYQAQTYTPNYTPFQFQQFVPQPSPQSLQQRNDLLQRILNQPQTMGQQQQDQLFEQQKESANQYAKQLGQQANQSTAGRGLNAMGGTVRDNRQQIDQDLMNQLLSGRRQVSVDAAKQNRADELNALQLANQTYASDADQALRNYQATLAGQQAQAGEGQYASDLGLRAFGTNEAARQAQSQSALDTSRFNFEVTDTDRMRQLQEFLGVVGAIMEQQRLAENQRQFNVGTSNQVDQFGRTLGENTRQFNMNFGENARQFNNQLGYNWANSQNNNVNSILDLFARLYGG